VKSFDVQSRSGNYPVIFAAASEVRAAFQEIVAGDPVGGVVSSAVGSVVDSAVGAAVSLDNAVIIADTNTEGIAKTIQNALGLTKSGLTRSPLIVPPGEASKSLEMAEHIYQKLIELKANRRTLIIAVGGGVVGDLVGFVAGTFMRGLPYVHIPTTLMAQVDSSIGGKVGVNLPAGKNLVGLFYPPRGVVSVAEFLETMPHSELRSGFVEAAKQAALVDADLFAKLEALQSLSVKNISPLISEIAAVKIGIVSRDEFENSDERIVLNLGHTVGHAIERGCHYEGISHGEAVGFGIILEHQFSNSPALPRLNNLFSKLQILPQVLPSTFSFEGALSSISTDKKAVGGSVKLPILEDIGRVVVKEVDIKTLTDFLRTPGLLSGLFLR
jgi:3-dehydroquinate synthase